MTILKLISKFFCRNHLLGQNDTKTFHLSTKNEHTLKRAFQRQILKNWFLHVGQVSLFYNFVIILLFSGYHGSQGPLKVSDIIVTPVVDTFLKAGQEMGYTVRDVNGESQYGK